MWTFVSPVIFTVSQFVWHTVHVQFQDSCLKCVDSVCSGLGTIQGYNNFTKNLANKNRSKYTIHSMLLFPISGLWNTFMLGSEWSWTSKTSVYVSDRFGWWVNYSKYNKLKYTESHVSQRYEIKMNIAARKGNN